MAPVTRTLPSLIGGVSQQAASLRRSSQMEMQENCFASIVEGNKKRYPIEYVAKLVTGSLGDAKVHTIDRDPTERYKVVLTNGNVKVFDINGVEKTVTFPDGTTYLNASMPSQALRLITIADYTFVVNNTVPVAMTADLSATRGPEALIFVKQPENDVDYTVTVNANTFTWHTAASQATAAGIATSIKAIAGFPGTGVTATQDRSVLWLQSASPLTVKAAGPNIDVDMRSFTKQAQNFTDLPTIAPKDYHIEVTGAQANNFDNYYVKFQPDNASATFDSGVWVETMAEGISYKLDAATMPHILIRNGDGTFTFKKATWTDRKVGDDLTAAIPSFVGKTINDVLFFKDRLGFLSDSNVVCSETGKFFNFFRTTVTTLLDTDPIDVSVNEVAILRSSVEFDKQLLLFSDKPVFTLGGDPLTPKSASTDPVTKFESIPTTQPVATDHAVYFASPKGEYAGLREMIVDPVSGRPDAPEVTAHVPRYIPGTITKLALSQAENMLVALADGQPTSIYAHNYFWNSNQKLQSSWGKWTFNGATIVSAEFLNSVLYLVVQRTDGAYLVKMDISARRTDSTDVDYLTHLDMRISEAQCVSRTYNAGTNRTTFTLPYAVNTSATYEIVTRHGTTGDIAGIVMQNVVASGSTLACDGDVHSTNLYIGEKYTQQFELSQQFCTFKDAQGSEMVIPDAELKLLFMTFSFERTGYFKVQVDFDHRPDAPQVTEFTGRIIGSGNNTTDEVALEDGKLRTRIGGDSRRVTITISNDSFLPCNMQSISWEGREHIRTKQGA